MFYCEDCRKERGWPVSTEPMIPQGKVKCEICMLDKSCWNVSTLAIPLPGEMVNSPDNPFAGPSIDPRAQAIQDARDQMAAGHGASTSLAPNYERLKELVSWMAGVGYSALQVAEAVAHPEVYWEAYRQYAERKHGGHS
jgi:hypothetical protein